MKEMFDFAIQNLDIVLLSIFVGYLLGKTHQDRNDIEESIQYNNEARIANESAIIGRVEELELIYMNHHYVRCPQCNRLAIAGAGCEGVRFICPHCEAESTWEVVDIKGRIVYLLIPDTPRATPETPVKSPLLREIEILRNAKRR